MAQPNGPRAARTTGRQRNSLINNASHQGAAAGPPLLSPGQTTAFGMQLANAELSLSQRLALIKAQKGVIGAQFKMDRAGVRADRISGMASAVNSSLDRGILNSSIDYSNRSGVEAEAARGLAEAQMAKIQGKLGLRGDRIQAFNEYYTTQYQVASQQAAAEAEAANQAFINDLVMRLGDESGGGNGRAGRDPRGQKPPYADTAVADRESFKAPQTDKQQMQQVAAIIGPFLRFLPDVIKQQIMAQIRDKLSMGVV